MKKFIKAVRESLYPSGIKCIVCDAELSRDTRYGICEKCKLPHNQNYCTVCGRAVPEQNKICDQCKNSSISFEAARSSFVYRDGAAVLVQRLKYGNARYLASAMAEFMADTYFSTDWEIDCVTCVPLHKSRFRLRGYNQSELLAKELSARINKEYVPMLNKTTKTKNMAKLNRSQRIELIKNTFSVIAGTDVRGKTVLLVDDVLTTGSTAGECARILREGGASFVYVLTFASVPYKPITV